MQYLAICCNILRYLAILCIHYITLHCWKDIHNKLEICLAPCPSPCFYTATPSKKCQALQLQFWNRVALGITKHHLKPSQFQVYFISKLYKHTYCNPSFFRILSLFQNFRKMSLLQKRLSLIEKNTSTPSWSCLLVSANFLYAGGLKVIAFQKYRYLLECLLLISFLHGTKSVCCS